MLLSGIYRILRPLGGGGLGKVYLAYHENLKKYVVVKKVKENCVNLINCRLEADILKSLHHCYLPQVYDFFQIGSGIYTVMDYINGYDMQFWLDKRWPLEEKQLLKWLRQLCEVLDYLHTRTPKVLHCDIKPANIMVAETGEICLIDFNISIDGENSKRLVGISSRYASPEQVRQAEQILTSEDESKVKIDERSDLYSLGAVFYRLMSGLMPEKRRVDGIRLADMELPYSDGLVHIVDKLMANERTRRFASAGKVLEALDGLELWSRKYRRLVWMGRAADCAIVILSAIFCCIAVYAYRGEKITDFFQQFEAFQAEAEELYLPMVENEQIREIMNDGILFLNDALYSKIMDQYEEQKETVLYSVGQAALRLEDVDSAVYYLERAAACTEQNPDVFRDLAIAQVLSQDYDLAEQSLEEAQKNGLTEEDSALVEAQIADAKQDYGDAFMFACQALGSRKPEVKRRATVLAVQSAGKNGEIEKGIELIDQMLDTTSGAERLLWLQSGGELCVMALEDEVIESEQAVRILSMGMQWYEELASENCLYEDDLNRLVLLYEKAEEFQKCKSLLMEALKRYPENYKIPMHLAYVIYRIESDKPIEQREYSSVKIYYRTAQERGTKMGIDINADPGMIQLERIIDQIEQQENPNK